MNRWYLLCLITYTFCISAMEPPVRVPDNDNYRYSPTEGEIIEGTQSPPPLTEELQEKATSQAPEESQGSFHIVPKSVGPAITATAATKPKSALKTFRSVPQIDKDN